jgi:hypothetical protein
MKIFNILSYRFVELRLSTSDVIATKAPQLLYKLVQDKNVRPKLASKDAFEALIPIVKEEKELGKCGKYKNKMNYSLENKNLLASN